MFQVVKLEIARKPAFGSNIQSTSWNSETRTYTYDGLNRLTKSTGANREELEYDRNGNITKLKRWLNNTMVDDLTYNYNGVGNQLGSVIDYSSGSNGFKTGSSNGFSYDGNGNMTADNSKNINVSYNDLNLVRQVTGGVPTQNYLYGGNGQKLAQHNGTQWKNYLGAGEYVAGKIYRMTTAEGYIVPNTSYTAGSSTGKYSYYYNLSDHLGNIRIVIGDDANATQIQTNDYTPFVLAINSDVSKKKYLYNGKELQDGTNWLDYGARMYYPELGRFFNVDRFSEKYYDFSSYQYAANNPIRFIDINGDSISIAKNILNDKVLYQAFMAFANSSVGYAFLQQYAKAGQKIGSRTFKSDGKYHLGHINLNYTAYSENKRADGTTTHPTDLQMKYLKPEYVDINININLSGSEKLYQKKDLFGLTEVLFHESFIHGDLNTSDYWKDKKFDFSNLPNDPYINNADDTHKQHAAVSQAYFRLGNKTPFKFGSENVERGLQEAAHTLNLNYNKVYIIQRMWNFSGELKIDKNGKPVR